jgi:CrcB protein
MIQPLYIAMFGVLGVLLRYLLGSFSSKYILFDFPFATLFVNILGSFFIGVVYVLGVEREVIKPEISSALMTGLLGGFTTFSAFSLETIRLLERQQVTVAVAYILTSILGGLVSVALAFYLTRLISS